MQPKLPSPEEINRDAENNGTAIAEDEGLEPSDGINAPVEQEDDELDLVVHLKTPYEFEGTAYTEIDLSRVECMTTATANNMKRIAQKRKKVRGIQEQIPVPAIDQDYLLAVAERVTGLPLEFFEHAPAQIGEAVKTKLTNFFMKLV